MSFANVYHLRRVAEASAKPCEICYKPTTAVLITADNKTDFFYVCMVHLKDKGFASPIIDEKEAAAKAKKKKEELEAEVERVKKEYEEKQKKKKEKEKEKKDTKKDGEGSDSSEKKKGKEKEEEKDKEGKSDTKEESKATEKDEEIPRIYALHRTLYQARLTRARNAELAKRNRERLKNPSTFPRVPSGDL